MLEELAKLFLRLGVTAFGGPAAHIAIMEDEVVRRRRWLSREEFLDMLGATNLIPGPNSTEMAIHIGYRQAGWAGLWVAGCCFILPAAAITLVFAWAYVRLGNLPRAAGLLYGIKPAMIAIVAQALIGLTKSAVKSPFLAALVVVSIVASLLGIHELAILFSAGAAAVFVRSRQDKGTTQSLWLAAIPIGGIASAAAPFSLSALFLFFLKVGSVLFGSGYVLLAFLRGDLVERLHWLTQGQLLDAIAVGQLTPGPVFTTATFIGYILGGIRGSGLATLGIFLPSFIFVAASGKLIPKIRSSKLASAFLDGVNAASLALMFAVSAMLVDSAVVDLPTLVIALAGGLLLWRYRFNSCWLVLAGGVIGTIFKSI